MIAITLAEIAKAGAALRSYDDGRTTEAPDLIEGYIRRSHDQPEIRGWLEQEMVKTLESNAPYGARRFACETLWMLGGDKAVPALAKLLTGSDGHLAEAACYAISRRPSAAADSALRQALGAAKDRALVAIVNLLGDRRDPQSTTQLAALASTGNPATSAAAAAALGKIATPDAVAALVRLRTPVASAGLLQAAQELMQSGDAAAATAVLRKLGDSPEVAQIRRGADLMRKESAADGEGFRPLFNGRDLSDFHVDTASVWSVRNGVIIGSSPGLKYNEFLRTRASYANFILHAKLRLIDGYGNSGFQFRSVAVPDSHEVSGYQADAGERYWGSLYDESRRRKTLAGPDDSFLDKLDPSAWHSYIVTATGNHIRIEMDGVETVRYEEHEPGIAPAGFIALQVHATPRPSEVWFRDLRIREL